MSGEVWIERRILRFASALDSLEAAMGLLFIAPTAFVTRQCELMHCWMGINVAHDRSVHVGWSLWPTGVADAC